jgi:hypothetical protein
MQSLSSRQHAITGVCEVAHSSAPLNKPTRTEQSNLGSTLFRCHPCGLRLHPSPALLQQRHEFSRPSVFGRNLQCQSVREVDTREEYHWPHACLFAASVHAWKIMAFLGCKFCRGKKNRTTDRPGCGSQGRLSLSECRSPAPKGGLVRTSIVSP